MAKILIIDDDKTLGIQLGLFLEELGHSRDSSENLEEAVLMANENPYDLIFLDIFLPDASGLSGISKLKQSPSKPEIIIITGHGDPDGAEIALTNGAFHYIEKPPVFNNIKLLVERALEYRTGKNRIRSKSIFKRDFIIGKSIKLLTCLEQTERAATSQGNVLITGETGTGKELIAKAVHLNSLRSQKEFVIVDCTNITPGLASSLLFGHKKGTYTGADRDKSGLVAQAHEGTLFFDEVGDLPLETQKSLLRVLQEKKYRPLGSKNEIHCNFRVVSATNKNLDDEVKNGTFREDLYYRLSMFTIKLPPLRERLSDLNLLISHHVNEICSQSGINKKTVSSEYIDVLKDYTFPGNIRELINVLHTSISEAGDSPVLYPHSLPVELRVLMLKKQMTKPQTPSPLNQSSTDICSSLEINDIPLYKDFQDQMEHDYITKLLKTAKGDILAACRASGLSRARIYQILKKYGIKGIRG